MWLTEHELASALLGAAHRGAVAVPLAMRLGAPALAYHLRACGAVTLVAPSSRRELAREALALAPDCRELVEIDEVLPEDHLSTSGVEVKDGDPALVWFAPAEPELLRGLVRDHREMLVAITAIAEALRLGPADVVRVSPPHDEGSLLVSQAALFAGARLADAVVSDGAPLRILRVPAALAAAAELAPAEELLRARGTSRAAATERSALEVLDATLPILPSDSSWHSRAASRALDYPTGCGRGASIALEAGLKPMLRELIAVPDLDEARARFESAGLHVEISPLVFGRTADGWLGRPESREETRRAPPDDRRPLYVGPDRGLLARAVRAEVSRTLEGARELGLLLGYPACCVEAFVAHGIDRRAHKLWARALERTGLGAQRGRRLEARLNVLDHAIFSYVSWFPCRFDCEESLRLADALAAIVAARHPGFVETIDRVLGAPRLVLAPEVQLTVEGAIEGAVIRVRSLRASAQDRDPRISVEPRETDLAARALSWLEGARTLAVQDGAVRVDGVPRTMPLEAPLPLLFPFEPPRAI